MSIAQSIGRVALKVVIVVVALITAIALLLQFPPVQTWIAQKATDYLAGKTDTEISIGKVRISLWDGAVEVKELFVEDEQHDTLLAFSSLEVGVQIPPILQRKVLFNELSLVNAVGKMYPVHDTVMNYQFLIDALSSGAPADTTSGKPWEIGVRDASLLLDSVHFFMELPDSVIQMDLKLGDLSGFVHSGDLNSMTYDIPRFALRRTRLDLTLGGEEDPEEEVAADSSDASSGSMEIATGSVVLEDIAFAMHSAGLELKTEVPRADSENIHYATRGDTMAIEAPSFQLADGYFRFDLPEQPATEDGIDYSHMALDSIQIDLRDMEYLNLDIQGTVNQLAAREKSGIALTSMDGNFHYNPDLIEIAGLHASTYHSLLDIPEGKLDMGSEGGETTVEDLEVDIDIADAEISPADIAIILPSLKDSGYLDVPANDKLRLRARARGSMRELDLPRFDLRGWGARVAASGRLSNLTEVERLRMDLNISPLSLDIPVVKRHLPDSLLPAELDLPSNLLANARLAGGMDSLHVDLHAQTGRPDVPVSALLEVEGFGKNLLDSNAIYYDARVDSLLVMREELAAYLPDSIDLPDAVLVQSELRGDLDTVRADYLRVQEERDSAGIQLLAHGKVDIPGDGKDLGMDVIIDTLLAPSTSLLAYLPDSTLPHGVILPDIAMHGFVRGSPDSLETELQARLAEGGLHARAFLEDSTYQARIELDSFQVANWMDTLYYDTLIGIALLPFDLDVELHGEGFDPREHLDADLRLHLMPLDTSETRFNEGFILNASAENMSAYLSGMVNERGLVARLSGNLDFNEPDDSLAQIAFNLDQLNLQELRLSHEPVYARAALTWESRGKSIHDVDVVTGLRGVTVVYDTVRIDIDSLMLDASLHGRENQVELRSDIATGTLAGRFEYPQIFYSMGKHVKSYFVPLGPRDSIFTQPQDSISLMVDVTDPSLLTTGLIPGLTELSPFRIAGVYTPADSVMSVSMGINHIKYQSIVMDRFTVGMAANQDSMIYLVSLYNLEGPANFQAGNIFLQGLADENNKFVNTFTQLGPDQQPRFALSATFQREEDFSKIVFDPEQLLDRTVWTMPEENAIEVFPESIEISNWALRNGEKEIALGSANQSDLSLTFRNLDLDLIGEILKDSSDIAGGILDGSISAANLRVQPRLSADLRVRDFTSSQTALGDLSVKVEQQDSSAWLADLGLQGEGSNFTLQGTYAPANERSPLDFALNANPLSLAPLAPLSFGSVTASEGYLYANMQINGTFSEPVIDGQMRFQEARVTPAMLGIPFGIGGSPISFSGSLSQGTNVDISSLTLTDDQGRNASLSGSIRSYNLSEHNFNLSLDAQNFHVMNTTADDNELYYGNLFVNLDGRVSGPLDSLDLTLQAQPTNESKLTYTFPVNQVEQSESYEGIITFEIVEPPDSSLAFLPSQRDSVVRSSSSGLRMFMTLNLVLDENLELTIITDPVAGDYFKGSAEGNLSLQYAGQDNIQLGGQISILEESLYYFTYTEIVRREFDVLPGSTVTWTSDPADPELDVSAKYVSRASPRTLVEKYLGETSSTVSQELRRRQDFNVVFKISGELDDMAIETSIEYPSDSPINRNISEINSAVSTLNQDESETNSQAFSLLLFNSFLATSGGGGGKLINLSQGFSDVITGFLNNFADQYIGFVELDFDIESGSDNFDNYFADTDFRVSLKKRFLNDRLEISVDGVASSNDPNARYDQDRDEMQAYLDNIEVEYSLTPDGVLKVRVFNERDTDDFIGGDVIKLGGALVFSKSFKRLRLFGPKQKQPSTSPQSEEEKPGENDNSTQNE